MWFNDKIKRAVSFYLTVAAFFILLPIVLSYSLGYRIDYRKAKIYKTGIIFVNSQPAGANVYINDRKIQPPTPARIEELKPGRYRVKVQKDGFYTWERELAVRPNMVTKADRIVLFPVTNQMNRISKNPVSDFAVSDRNSIYHMTDEGLFVSAMDGSGWKKISGFSNWPKGISGKKFSPGGDKFLFFSKWNVYIIYLNIDKSEARPPEGAKVERVFVSEDQIIDVFWFSKPDYIIVVNNNDVEAVELRGEKSRNVVKLYEFNVAPQYVYYDSGNDSLYFTDSNKESLAREGNYIYRLDMRKTFLDSLKKLWMGKESEGDNAN